MVGEFRVCWLSPSLLRRRSKPIGASTKLDEDTRRNPVSLLESIDPSPTSDLTPPTISHAYVPLAHSSSRCGHSLNLHNLLLLHQRCKTLLQKITTCTWFIISFCGVVFLGLCLSLWWSFWKADVSGGFTLGTFITGSGCAVVKLFHTKHREDGRCRCSRPQAETAIELGEIHSLLGNVDLEDTGGTQREGLDGHEHQD